MQQLDNHYNQLQPIYSLLKPAPDFDFPCDKFTIKQNHGLWVIEITNINKAFWKDCKSGVEYMCEAYGLEMCEDGWKDGEKVYIFSGQ